MAMSSWKSTFVVGVFPEVKVIYKWPRPPAATAALPQGTPSPSPGASTPGPGGATVFPPCLAWGSPHQLEREGKAPAWVALLARGWGSVIQILEATMGAHRPCLDEAGGGVGDGGGLWPRFGVVKELSASAPVVAVEWLQDQV
ncbi:unnamed protein product [Discosporangium mesarthrocarpum]